MTWQPSRDHVARDRASGLVFQRLMTGTLQVERSAEHESFPLNHAGNKNGFQDRLDMSRPCLAMKNGP